jgi:hypothetical protein
MDNFGVATDNGQILNQTAQLVFESFENTDITFALISNQGHCITNRPKVFRQVLSNQKLLNSLCQKIDDGDEPKMAYIGDSLIAASGLSIDKENSGYIIMILPGYTPDKMASCMEFIEVILNQISLLAQQVELNAESSCFGGLAYDCRIPTDSALN